MTDRLIDISEESVRISIRGALLVIGRDSGEVTIPVNEIAAVVASHPSTTLTHVVLARLAKEGAAFIACDEKHLPVAMLLPLESHFLQTERFTAQVQASLPKRKRLWKDIVRAKIKAQARLLRELRGDDQGLSDLVPSVHSGDPENVEAQAAKKYWPALFADRDFRRDREKEDQNRFLNYGYAILRATVSRAICASGLHPSISLHHHNRYNAFCLADDLMEPLRPLVDRIVVRWSEKHGKESPLDKNAKAAILAALSSRYKIEGEERTLFDLLARYASSLAKVYGGGAEDILIPEL